jgi:transcriptional regulator of acetoin/glycerol metabolism
MGRKRKERVKDWWPMRSLTTAFGFLNAFIKVNCASLPETVIESELF